MTKIVKGTIGTCKVYFISDKKQLEELNLAYAGGCFEPDYLNTYYLPLADETSVLLVGTRNADLKKPNTIKELAAVACKEMRKLKISEFTLYAKPLLKEEKFLSHIVQSICLVTGKAKSFKTEQKEISYTVGLEEVENFCQSCVEEGTVLAEAVLFARDMVNMPANYLRPEDFAREIQEFVKDTDVEAEILTMDVLEEKKMGGLLGVGGGSEFPPCMMVLRYKGNPDSKENTGLIGKGVTVDTGGYCLKPAASMGGIRGDMAGAAAVAGAVYALAKRKAKVNVTAVMPMCENRISGGSFVDGDVLTSYSGKTIEVANTDAEGRLILADAVTYAVRDEKVTRVLDIATLTGAVVGMFGFTVAGVVSDNDAMWEEFWNASLESGEKHWRIPFDKEHEKMIESNVADIRNMGASVCGTITAGLFIRSFAEGLPWLHVDIAGTAWVDDPIYAYQEKLATGTDVDTIYRWLNQ